jgi:FkbM family methyltransferase
MRLKVFSCGHPDTPDLVTRKDCAACPHFESVPHHADLTEASPVRWVKELLRMPPGPWPHPDWVGYPNVIQAVREILREAADDPPPPPEFPAGRGVVICGGGWRYFPSVYVTVRMLRLVGCTLPVQVWYLGDAGEFDVRMAQALDGWDVGWVDAQAMWRDRPGMRVRRLTVDHGWMLKPFAAAFCPFREVLLLDADSYPVANPEWLMDHPECRRVGAVFWPDFNPLEAGQWERFGVPVHHVPGLESGQFFVDKARHWRPLYVACWLNALHDYTYRHLYGDKDTFNIAWRLCGHEMCVPTRRPGWLTHSFLQKDFAGRVLFVHRTRDKFRFTGEVDGAPVSNSYSTHQRAHENHFEPRLPLEAEAFDFLRQCNELIRPHHCFRFRPEAFDREIWEQVNLRNEYRLPPRLDPSRDVILDVGANAGAFTHAVLRRGVRHVHAVEPEPGNVAALKANLRSWLDLGLVTVHEAAAWRSDPFDGPAPSLTSVGPGHTESYSLLRPDPGFHTPRLVRFDDLVLAATGNGRLRLRLAKLDCEGSEFPCLYTSHTLHLIDELVGEYHDVADPPGPARVEGAPPFTGEALAAFLRGRGFDVTLHPYSGQHGLFFARRPPPPG